MHLIGVIHRNPFLGNPPSVPLVVSSEAPRLLCFSSASTEHFVEYAMDGTTWDFHLLYYG